jgi:hypothetical protein
MKPARWMAGEPQVDTVDDDEPRWCPSLLTTFLITFAIEGAYAAAFGLMHFMNWNPQ